MSSIDDLAKQLAAAAERQRLEAEAKAAESAPAPDMSAALEKLTQTLAEAKPTPLPGSQPADSTARTAEDKKPH